MTTTKIDYDIPAGAKVIDTADFYIPTPKQSEAHASLAKYVLYGGSIGCGKSVFGCMEGTTLNMEYPGNVGLICRWELDSLRRTTLQSFGEICPADLITGHNQSTKEYYHPNGSKIIYMGLRPSSNQNLETRLGSLSLGWFFIDESSEVPKKVFDILKQRLRHRLPDGSYPRFRGLLASNPTDNWVKEIFVEQNLPNHDFIPALPGDNPHLPPGYIDDLIQDLPEELVEQYLKGNWSIMTQGLYVFPYQWVKAAMERKMEPGEPVECGLDVGAGGDETVLAGRRGPVAEILHRSKYKDTMTTVGQVSLELDEFKPETTKVDTVGIGKGVYDRLNENDYFVVPVVGGARARNPERFANAKAENHWGLRDRLEAGNASLPNMRELMSELVGIKYEIGSDRIIKIESKEKRKARGLPSPNLAEGVIYAFAGDSGELRLRWVA